MMSSESLADHETIMVVEDSPHIRRIVCVVLQTAGFHVLKATGGAEALRLAESHQGKIDLLLSDVFMPSMNGFDLAEQIVQMRPQIAVLFMSGSSELTLTKLTWQAIQKPFSHDELLAKVGQALQFAKSAVGLPDPNSD